MKVIGRTTIITSLILSGISLTGCNSSNEQSISPQRMADAMYAVMEADRAVYAEKVVNRLQNKEKVIHAKERWEDEKALPLPAQMFRMGAERVREHSDEYSYALLSLWPVNKQNKPKTQVEKDGLAFVNDNPEQNFYGEEQLGEHKYFTAVYPDAAVSEACVSCHNEHIDSPRNDFKLNDVMGGVVIRIKLD